MIVGSISLHAVGSAKAVVEELRKMAATLSAKLKLTPGAHDSKVRASGQGSLGSRYNQPWLQLRVLMTGDLPFSLLHEHQGV